VRLWLCGTCWQPLKTAGQPCDEHLAPLQRWLALGSMGPSDVGRPLLHGLSITHTLSHTRQEAHGPVARAHGRRFSRGRLPLTVVDWGSILNPCIRVHVPPGGGGGNRVQHPAEAGLGLLKNVHGQLLESSPRVNRPVERNALEHAEHHLRRRAHAAALEHVAAVRAAISVGDRHVEVVPRGR
jgi:hypothetical protein